MCCSLGRSLTIDVSLSTLQVSRIGEPALELLADGGCGPGSEHGEPDSSPVHADSPDTVIELEQLNARGKVKIVVSPMLLICLTVVVVVVCLHSADVPRVPLMATLRGPRPAAASGSRFGPVFLKHELAVHRASKISVPGGPRSRREARGFGRDPLRDHRATVGPDVRTPWLIRLRSLMVLVVLVIGLGMAIAGVTLLIIASGRFVLETLAG